MDHCFHPGFFTTMVASHEKKNWILEHERQLAVAVAHQVIEKPTLSIWMILIPVIFVYYFYRLQKYAGGRKEFAEHFMISRERALDESFTAVKSGERPDSLKLCRISTVPSQIYAQYENWLNILIDHYMDLLRAEGGHLEDLIRSVYKNRTNYLLFLNRLNDSEKRFNAVLAPYLRETTEGVDEIVSRMERVCEKLRRKEAERIFP